MVRDSNSAPQDDSALRSLPPLRAYLHDAISWCRWQGAGRVALVCTTCVSLAAFGWWMLKVPPPSADSSIPRAVTSSNAVGTDTATMVPLVDSRSKVTVHVVGAVKNPGVYSLAAPARVVDGLRAAGGATTVANLEVINLARSVRDGEQVYIPPRGHRTGGATKRAPRPPGSDRITGGATTSTVASTTSRLININTAGAKQLEELPGVGPSTARAIVDYRIKHGPFVVVDDLNNVSGIGPSKLDAMRRYVTV